MFLVGVKLYFPSEFPHQSSLLTNLVHPSRQGWLLRARLGAASPSYSCGANSGANASESERSHIPGFGANGPQGERPAWRASGGALPSPGADAARASAGRLSASQLHAALLLVRFPPSTPEEASRHHAPAASADADDAASRAALLPALLRTLLVPSLEQLPTRQTSAATSSFGSGCSPVTGTLPPTGISVSPTGIGPLPTGIGPATTAQAHEARERVACARVLRHALLRRMREAGAGAPLALHAAAAVVAALGEGGAPEDGYGRALVESQVGIMLDF